MGLLFNILLTLSFFSVFAHSRILPTKTPKTTVLDVSSAIGKSRTVLSIDPQTTQAVKKEDSADDVVLSLRVELHSRVSVKGALHSDYRSVVLARLERDSARVDSLNARLGLLVNGVALADLKAVEREFAAEELEGPVVSGTSQGSGEYFSRVSIGRPPSPVYMVLDTGSDVNWVQCAPCADCYEQADPIFEPASSASYAPLSCGTQQCRSLDVSECRNGTCLYEVSYGDGSYTVGEFVTETITLGSTPVHDIAIGCGHNNEGLFIGAAGLLGLGGGKLSFPSQLNASSFSYCLVDRDSDSASTLEFDTALPPHAVTAPLLRNPQADTFYYIELTGLTVGGESLPISESAFRIDRSGNGGIIIDSGTAVTRLQTEVYESLRDAFVRGSQHLPSTAGVALFDTCYDLSAKNSVEVPTVSFRFKDGSELALPANNYLIPVDSEGTFCFAFAPTASGLSIIGNVQQQGIRVGFDLRNSLVGFSPSDC